MKFLAKKNVLARIVRKGLMLNFKKWLNSLLICRCWHHNWDRWNTPDERKCALNCGCRCHKIEDDFLFSEREKYRLTKQKAELAVKIYNLEETYEPAIKWGSGPTICRCNTPSLYCRNCKGIDGSRFK